MAEADSPHRRGQAKGRQATARGLAQREREQQAFALRRAGASFPQIAQALGLHDGSAASKLVHRALERLVQEPAEEVRKLEVERLNELYRQTSQILARHHPVLHQGAPVSVENDRGETVELEDDAVRLAAIGQLLKIQERTARLYGLDAPKQVELSGSESAPLSIEVRAAQAVERLRELKARPGGLAALPAAPPDDGGREVAADDDRGA